MYAICGNASATTGNSKRDAPVVPLQQVAPEGIGVLTIYRGVTPFIILQLIGLIIIFNWDALVTWLPAQRYG